VEGKTGKPSAKNDLVFQDKDAYNSLFQSMWIQFLLACLPDTRLAVPKLDTATIALSDSTRTIAATIVLAIP
jgi:hypothetical protein